MAISFVQAATGTVSVASSTTATWGSNTTSGNTIIVLMGCNSQITGGYLARKVTDSQGNDYIFGGSYSSANSTATVEFWTASNIVGGTTPVVTVNFQQNVTGGIITREYSGLALANSFDTWGYNGPISGSSTPTSKSTPIATRYVNEVVIGFVQASTTSPTFSLGSGFSNLTTVNGTNGFASEDQVVSSIGPQTAGFNATTTPAYSCLVACFADTTCTQPTTQNNFQFPKVYDNGNGVMSVTEKIR
jgi:hypothetical protein